MMDKPTSQEHSRNKLIAQSLERGRKPVLPYEMHMARGAIVGFVQRQETLGQELGEAMSQGAETFHDNAPADAVVDDSRTLEKMAYAKLRVIGNSEIFDYPQTEETVTLGSIVALRFEDEEEVTHHFISGMSTNVPEDVYTLPEELDIEDSITLASPLGQALFDKKPGDVVEFEANGKSVLVEVVKIY